MIWYHNAESEPQTHACPSLIPSCVDIGGVHVVTSEPSHATAPHALNGGQVNVGLPVGRW